MYNMELDQCKVSLTRSDCYFNVQFSRTMLYHGENLLATV